MTPSVDLLHQLPRDASRLEDRIRVLESALENMGDGVVAVDEDGRLLLINATARRIYGRTPGEGPVDRWTELHGIFLPDRETPYPPNQLPLARALRGESTDQVELFFRNGAHPDGLFVASTGRPLRDEHHRICGAIAVMRDISQQKQAEAALRETNQRLALLVAEQGRRADQSRILGEMSSLLQAAVGFDEVFTIVGDYLERLLPGSFGAFFAYSASRDDLEQKVAWGRYAKLRESALIKPTDCWGLRRGRPHRVEGGGPRTRCTHVRSSSAEASVCVPVLGPDETIGLLHVRFEQESPSASWEPEERELCAVSAAEHVGRALINLRLRVALQQQSIRDPLTGLFNRRFLEETLVHELRRAQRKKSALCVLMLDVDHFKQFNDRYGHAAGDGVLKQFGSMLMESIRGSDIASRYGGEEFMVLLRDASVEGGRSKAEQLLERTRTLRLNFSGTDVGIVTASIGVSAFPDHGAHAEHLIHAADGALYAAKQGGRDQVKVAGR